MVCYAYVLCLYFVVYMFCYDFPVAEKGIKNMLYANILEKLLFVQAGNGVGRNMNITFSGEGMNS